MPRVTRSIDPGRHLRGVDVRRRGWAPRGDLARLTLPRQRLGGAGRTVVVRDSRHTTARMAHRARHHRGADTAKGPEARHQAAGRARPLDGIVATTRTVKVLLDHHAVTLATGGLPGRLITYPKGTRFPADAEIVTQLPDDAFRKV